MKLLNNLGSNEKNKNQNNDYHQRKIAIQQNNFNTAKKNDERETTPI